MDKDWNRANGPEGSASAKETRLPQDGGESVSAVYTRQLKAYAKSLGADLVGVADPARWKTAPFNRSPQALMPDCTATVTLGFHYLDACVELGGQPDARMPGPAVSNHIASEHGNYAAFKLCKYIEGTGYDALMVPATGWWNYRANQASPRGFAADITHYYAACAAGLGEIAWNNLCMTPEFGPRQRWITLVTNAPLAHDPMYQGEKLCDGCKLCERHCPGDAFTKEAEGVLTVDFGERSFTFKNKNLWRCAMGENFQLDSFMERPEKIDGQVVKELCEDWARGGPEKRFSWKMGMCLKWCMTHERRYFDRSFTQSPRRRRDVQADETPAGAEAARRLLGEWGREIGVSRILLLDQETLSRNGLNLRQYLPTAQSAVSVIQYYPEGCQGDTTRQCMRNALWLAKRLEIQCGYDTMVESGIDHQQAAAVWGGPIAPMPFAIHTIITSVPFTRGSLELEETFPQAENPEALRRQLETAALKEGADLFGISGTARIDSVAEQLKGLCGQADYFVAEEQGYGVRANRMIDMKGKPKNPGIKEVTLDPKGPEAYLPGARAVIVLGLGMLRGSVKNVMKPPAYKGAHWGATVHKEMFYQNQEIALKLCKILNQNGYRACMTDDLLNLSSKAYAFMLPDLWANGIPAVCAGLGALAKNGLAVNPTFGSKVRYIAIVTDAPLREDPVLSGDGLLCGGCEICGKACPAAAFVPGEEISLKIGDSVFQIAKKDRLRCDWAMRYGLMREAGPKCLGSRNDYPVPEKITREALLETIRDSDRLQISNFAPIVEQCMLACPYNQ